MPVIVSSPLELRTTLASQFDWVALQASLDDVDATVHEGV